MPETLLTKRFWISQVFLYLGWEIIWCTYGEACFRFNWDHFIIFANFKNLNKFLYILTLIKNVRKQSEIRADVLKSLYNKLWDRRVVKEQNFNMRG